MCSSMPTLESEVRRYAEIETYEALRKSNAKMLDSRQHHEDHLPGPCLDQSSGFEHLVIPHVIEPKVSFTKLVRGKPR